MQPETREKILKFYDGKRKMSLNNHHILIKVLRSKFNKMDDSKLRRTFINLNEHELELSSRFKVVDP
jgi:hypothetical protein